MNIQAILMPPFKNLSTFPKLAAHSEPLEEETVLPWEDDVAALVLTWIVALLWAPGCSQKGKAPSVHTSTHFFALVIATERFYSFKHHFSHLLSNTLYVDMSLKRALDASVVRIHLLSSSHSESESLGLFSVVTGWASHIPFMCCVLTPRTSEYDLI